MGPCSFIPIGDSHHNELNRTPLHRNPPKRIRHRTCQNNNRKDRTQILNHYNKDFLSTEFTFSMADFLFHAVDTYDLCYE